MTEESKTPLPEITIDQMPAVMQKAVAQVGWSELMPVQKKAIPYFRAGVDLMVQAQTGSGKTGAFILPILELVDTNKKACQALILVPTRELAQQVARDATALAAGTNFGVVSVYGGSSYKPQIEAFKEGVQLVVGTPGRILDHLIKRNLKLDDLRILVFDEADRMMSMGFFEDMLRVQEFLPDRPVQTGMFSATFPAQVMHLTSYFLEEPEFISLSRETIYVEDTEHVFYLMPGMEKDRALVRIIEMENPQQTLIFCNTKDRVFYVARVLQRFGFNADQLSSDLSQSARDEVLNRLREGRLRFLVATDVAARGIDIPDLSHVIQYEPPEDLEAYIHRAGRTGRAGASGTAIMLVNYNEERQLTRIGAHYKIEFTERKLPQDEDVENLVSQRLIGQLEAKLRHRDRLQIERMQRFLPLVKELAEDEEGISLLAMLLDDTYHEWMHHPPKLEAVGTKAKRKESKPRGQRRSGSGQGGSGRQEKGRGSGRRENWSRSNKQKKR
ncbi:MAG: DEAD/DEAH box helicase [Anaerolineales bacterium]|nr:DEAD/DEAH box helicase [Anaerolineales bacterium]